MMSLGNIFGSLFAYQWKPFGLSNKLSDELLTEAGAFTSVTQLITRVIIGYLYDKVGFKCLNIGLLVIQVITSMLIFVSVKSGPFFFFVI